MGTIRLFAAGVIRRYFSCLTCVDVFKFLAPHNLGQFLYKLLRLQLSEADEFEAWFVCR